jgi:hypothetical protein
MPSAKNQDVLCNISTVPLAKGVMLLLQNSMLDSAYRALAPESQQLKALSQLLKTVQKTIQKTVQKIAQFKQVTYVSGGDYLHQVCEAIKQNCEVLLKEH